MINVETLRRNALSLVEELVLGLRNRWSRSSVVADTGGAVVSLTSYGSRLRRVHLVIESISRGSRKPSRLLLWVDDERFVAHLPPQLARLQARGLEILPTKDLGPHKKYYPYVESADLGLPLVTADDDVYYPRSWLDTLERGHGESPDTVIALRARWIGLTGGEVAPYNDWSIAPVGITSPRVFPTGVGGVLYPLNVQLVLRHAGLEFLACAPRADDVWLHANTLRAGASARQVRRAGRFSIVPVRAAGESGLWESNVVNNGNDPQIAATYSAYDVSRLANAEDSGERQSSS